ncbi:interferon-induced transmembrane protein 1-like [Nelusetta ayraudi]|uniref:interferon-induced transmembrane protein 1-like n=1 Tax=Nelusetta ayraudi TaxID=303726 RepID=UPI003F7172E6
MEVDYVPLQDTPQGLLCQNPAAPPLVQYTTVNMGAEPPKDHIIWSLITLFYCGNPCCLGLAAFIFSIKSRDRKVVGDLDGARHYGATARCLNIIVTAMVVTLVVIALIAVIIVVVQIQQTVRSMNNQDYRFPSSNNWGR